MNSHELSVVAIQAAINLSDNCGTQKYTSMSHVVIEMAFVCLFIFVIITDLCFCTFILFKGCINQFVVLPTTTTKSLKLRKPIGNDIHFHEESQLVVQPEFLHSQTTGVKSLWRSSVLCYIGHPPGKNV